MSETILRHAISKLDSRKKDRESYIPAVLGFLVNGAKTVEVSGRPGYVYARIRSNLNEVIQAFNDKVSPVYDLPVLLVRDPDDRTRYKVVGRDVGRYENWGSYSSYLPRHGNQHSFFPEGGGGGDIVWVYGKQFVPLSLSPSGTAGGPNVLINGYSYYQNFNWKYAGGTGTANLLAYKPTGSNARMVLVYLDGDGNPQALPGGSYFDASITGISEVLPYTPIPPDTTSIPIGAVRLVSGTSTIQWDNIYDLRPIIVGDGFIPTGTFGHVIEADGSAVAQRDVLNFVGDGFVVYDSGGKTNVSGTFSFTDTNTTDLMIYDDSVFKITGSAISFDKDISVVVSGSVAFVSIPPGTFASGTHTHDGGGGSGSSLTIYREGTSLGTATELRFEDSVFPYMSGTAAYIKSPMWQQIVINDDFITSNNTTQLGLNNFTTSNVGIEPSTPQENHPGIIRLRNTASNQASYLVAGLRATSSLYENSMTVNEIEYFGIIFRAESMITSTGSSFRAGIFTDNVGGTAYLENEDTSLSKGIYWSFYPGASPSYLGSVTKAAGKTRNDYTAVPYASGTWFLLEIIRAGDGVWEFYANGSHHATHTTNIPTGTATVGVAMPTLSQLNRIGIDWIGIRTKTYTQRW